ncbi:FAD-binding oxidoreductase [Nocardioides immobilis]|uniref:FAD-binding oxidoreductase n=1 Tax=Nocardioides immobilis TaxID=2049295 RepID=A0A417XXA2_9ACTN|nr:FAD-binding and (Fe-S)-binding domain-containing protein [Nocardioides immobilis]RHW24945.1 FAD-binding oxidoreductase [Nocardioides immobilis]
MSGPSKPAVSPQTLSAIETALVRGAEGEVDFSGGARAAYSSDSSNYRQVPLGVVFPRTAGDVSMTLQLASEYGVPVLARGAGTSLAGQACNEALILDMSRHMTMILDVDPDRRTARVQPGVVLDHLRAACAPYGLTFGPDPATHAWCTIGGMIGNNSCGTHSIKSGKTSDCVAELEVVLYGGERLRLGSYGDDQYRQAVLDGGTLARLLGSLREIGRRAEPHVRSRFPDLQRRVSGYNLDKLLPGQRLDIAKLLVGTESTCAVVTEAVVDLIPAFRKRRLVVLGYPSLEEAADAVPVLLRATDHLIALEGFDGALVDLLRVNKLHLDKLHLLPEGRGWLLAEIEGAAEEDLAVAERAILEAPASARPEARIYRSDAEMGGVWAMRESGLGATALRADGGHNYEGWEDAAVPPDQLGNYFRQLKLLQEEFGYRGAWYGHFGQGCVHTRNNFDLGSEAGLASYRNYVEQATDLVVGMGGSISGEHGDGQARGELLERMYGPEVVDLFRQVKAVFDPNGKMNPGKLVDPYPLDSNLRFGPAYARDVVLPSSKLQFVFDEDAGSLQHGAERCVGVGKCRSASGGVMCPSYRETGEERHSTRGRAKLLVEMFQGEVTPASWRNEDVRDALDLCLACKGCLTDCPTHVDMATYKAEFMSHFYRRRIRPRSMYALANLPWLARLATRAPRLANWMVADHPVGRTSRRVAGVTTSRPAPQFSSLAMRRELPRAGASQADVSVVIWPDTFTDAFNADAGRRLVGLFEEIGETVAVPRDWSCCGRTLYDAGMLGRAKRSLRRVLDVAAPWVALGVPIVVPEPSCLASFRDELPRLLADDDRVDAFRQLLMSPAEFLASRAVWERPEFQLASEAAPVTVHTHCHQRAGWGADAESTLLINLGYDVRVADAGCCGLAGSFGYTAAHAQVSRSIGEHQWLPALEDTLAGGTLVVDGFSCVLQATHLSGPQSTTLVDLVSSHVVRDER